MHHIIGWKRLESNKLIEFHDITEDNFESILRRFAVVQIQARFYEEAQVDGIEIDADTRGVFSRDSELDAFYVSGPAVAAGLKMQAGFEELHGKKSCLQMVQHFTRAALDVGFEQKQRPPVHRSLRALADLGYGCREFVGRRLDSFGW